MFVTSPSQPNGQNLTGEGLGNYTGSAGAYVPFSAEAGLRVPGVGVNAILVAWAVVAAVAAAGGGWGVLGV
jgi:hypothetical protein